MIFYLFFKDFIIHKILFKLQKLDFGKERKEFINFVSFKLSYFKSRVNNTQNYSTFMVSKEKLSYVFPKKNFRCFSLF